MAEVKLYKKLATYTDKNGEEKTATNLFVMCGDVLVPIEVKYFEDKETGTDKNYRSRKTLISALSDILPERETDGKKKNKAAKPAAKPAEQPFEDDSLPF